ncbi:GAF domain-containing sensor histidine kinase [Haloferax volcanii]|uniref:histidine kinase n=1 Tax=Haloferax lucentense (strain DSM 14919 / JCM 9276 / NCIMB 13854 / Aa 2.2) TaxID=1230452 RepID=M0GTX6_HALL2|nr:ATP-binding protein [Haloferax lucentense]ELZ75670.1 adaptive-response sensory-kinase [Haloferax lucentense DSM 14919]
MTRSPSPGSSAGTAPSVLFVAPDRTRADAVAAALDRHDVSVTVEFDLGTALGRVVDRTVDCLLIPGQFGRHTAADVVALVRERHPDVPVVLLGPGGSDGDALADDPAAHRVSGDIESLSYDRLADRVRAAVARYRSSEAQRTERDIVSRLERRIQRTERKITSLHGVAMRLASVSDADDIYAETVEAAERILNLDICFAFAAEADWFVPRAQSSTPTDRELRPVPKDAGAMGETFRTGESHRAVDMELHAFGRPEFGDYRSGLSVAIGSFGVFQAVSEQTGAFDEIDLELAELLVAHTNAALQRLSFERRLRVERDQYAALFENSADCIIDSEFVDGESVIRAVNPAFEATFGYDESEVVGRAIDDVVAPDDRLDEAAKLTEMVRAGDFVQTEVRRQTANGERDFLLRSVPVGEDTIYAVYTDITARRDIEREMEAQNRRLDEFTSVVSHDLRNPLSVATGHLDLAREEIDNDHLAAVARAHDRMTALTEELLVLARQGTDAFATTPVSLAETAERCWDHVETGDAALVVASDRTVVADAGRLHQLFENLMRNAVEHGSPDESGSADGGQDRVTVTVGALDDGFYVEDDGAGIPPELRSRIFDTGFSTGTAGIGFGLTIVSNVVDAHGWTVSVGESAAGGARFEFTGVGAGG